MMSSWLNQKAGEATTQKLDALSTTPIPSSPPQADEARAHRMSTENQPATYTTPHDIVLSELHRTFLKSGPTDTPSDPKENQDAATQAPTKEAAQQSTSRAPSTDVLMDPFDGSMLGVLLPQGQGSDSRNPSQVNLATNPPEGGPTGMYANPAGSEAVWSQLSRVLDIQGEISKMHLDMETIGLNKTKTGSAKKSQWKRRHKTPPPDTLGPSSDLGRGDISGVNWPRHRTLSTVSTISSSGEPEGDEAGVNFQDDDEAKTRIRGEEFARLASQFEGRKEAIYDIMAKLDDLSQALGEFHELPIPNIEFPASRNNSSGVASLPTEPDAKLGGPSARNTHLSSGSMSRKVESTPHNPTSLALAIPPLQRAKSDTATISTSPSILQRRKNIPTLLVNSLEFGSQPHIIESPVSTHGSKPPFDEQRAV